MTDDLSVGSCVGSPEPEMWFSRIPEDIALAKRICHECPARLVCLEGALLRGEQFGIFGGIDFEHERHTMLREPV